MKIEKRKVKDLKFYLGNPRQMKPEMLRKLENSIKEFGVVEPLVINKNNEVIGGNQRLKALQKLGIDEVDVIVLDLEKNKEKALNLALNKIQGEWNYKLLRDFAIDLDVEDIKLSGFDKLDLDDEFISFTFNILNTDGYFDFDKNVEDINSKKLGYRLESLFYLPKRDLCLDLFSGIGQLAFWYKRLFKKVIRVDKEKFEDIDYVMRVDKFIETKLDLYQDFDYVDFDDEGSPFIEIQLFFEKIKNKKDDFVLSFTDGIYKRIKLKHNFDFEKYYLYPYEVVNFDEMWEKIVISFFNEISKKYGFDYKIINMDRKKGKEVLYGSLYFKKGNFEK